MGKGKRIRVFRSCCAGLIRNVVRTFRDQASIGTNIIGVNQPQERAATALGISRRSIYRIEHQEEFLEPGDGETRDRRGRSRAYSSDASINDFGQEGCDIGLFARRNST